MAQHRSTFRTTEQVTWRVNQGVRLARAAQRGRAGRWLFWHEMFRFLSRMPRRR